jgi:hypothetical protein
MKKIQSIPAKEERSQQQGCQSLKPKIPIRVNFVGSWKGNGRCWYMYSILRPIGVCTCPFGLFYGHFGIFFPILACGTKKNLATLVISRDQCESLPNCPL